MDSLGFDKHVFDFRRDVNFYFLTVCKVMQFIYYEYAYLEMLLVFCVQM